MTGTSAAAPFAVSRASVVRAQAADLTHLSDILARAFDDDPVFRYLVRTDARRLAALRRLFRTLVRTQTLAYGETYLTDGTDGAAVWLPPGVGQPGVLQQLRLLPAMITAGGFRGLPRFFRTLAAMDESHPHEPHFYLMLLGVLPERQGRGVGSALLRDGLRRSDELGVPAYLEATSSRNVALYKRHGFVITGRIDLLDGPSMWPMSRRPAAGGS